MNLCGQTALSHHLARPGLRARFPRRVVAVRAAERLAAQGGPQRGWRQHVGALSEAQQQDVLAKLAQGGFVGALEDLVPELDAAKLQQLGIEPMAVREVLLRAFELVKREERKTILLEGADGEVIEYELNRDGFRGLTSIYLLFQKSENGGATIVSTWEELKDGGVYSTDRSLPSQVQAHERFQENMGGALEEETREKGVAFMQEQHGGRAQAVCRKKLKNNQGQSREFDALVEADSCVLVMETKLTIDMDAVKQLSSAIEFIKQGAADGAADLEFARGKEIKGALAGMRMVPGPQGVDVQERAKKAGWELWLLNGTRFSSGNACHTYQSPHSA